MTARRMRKTLAKTPPPRKVNIVRPEYQPSKAELEADLRVNATFEQALDTLAAPVKIRYIDQPKKKL